MSTLALNPEWERIDLLGACLTLMRRGETLSTTMTERLTHLQEVIGNLRLADPWLQLSSRHGLSHLDQEILACTVAPEAEPRLGWMYQELQGGLPSPYPTPALIRELLCITAQDSAVLHTRLTEYAPLRKAGLIEHSGEDSFAPLRATLRANAALLGWPKCAEPAPPGTTPIPALATWDDLVLPAHGLRALREFLLWVTCRNQVVENWGARSPGGPLALFAGPSGTGKTFAAEVIANTLGWPLYRVDLGLLVSKYVGETEKNLNALFDAAHRQDMVLLFDEADCHQRK